MTTSLFTIDDIKDALERNKWSSGVAWDLNETTTYAVFDYSTMTTDYKTKTQSASKVINSKVLDANDQVLMNWNTALFTYSGNYGMSDIFGGIQSTITEWNSDLSSLTNGGSMFWNCSNLTSFTSDLSSLTRGQSMFDGCNKLASFNVNLSSLTSGNKMFYKCEALTSFDSDLSSLTDGTQMFNYCFNLESFNSDLSSLTDGRYMFFQCSKLESFNSDLSNLASGGFMFNQCSSLTSFDSNLSSLTNGNYMFYGCKLNTASVQKIASTINTGSSGKIHIGIGNSTPNTEEETAFNTIANKGWRVYVNGDYSSNIWTPTASTNLTDEEEQSTPIPYYAKPIQVTEDEAEYVDANNNYYNIVGAQFIYGDDISTYGMFTSYEHAESEITLGLGLTKYIKPTEEEESEEVNQ